MSPGFASALNTPWLAWLPEFGCTLAKPQSNSFLARSMASCFDDVDVLAAAVVALAGIAFGILVGQHGAGCIEHGLRDDVLRRDQLDLMLLAAELLAEWR